MKLPSRTHLRSTGGVWPYSYFKLSPRGRQLEEVEDLVQETLIRGFRDIASFSYQSAGSFLRWLSSIADHVIIDRLRYQSRDCRAGVAVRFRSESNPIGPEPVDTKNPEPTVRPAGGDRTAARRFEKLPEDYRQAILMAKVEGCTTGEMPERLGKSRESVALLVYRAVKRFRALSEGAEE
jgi:RNA polymerase sigma factor (sigma-70 family)